jgi:hypothetical protein
MQSRTGPEESASALLGVRTRSRVSFTTESWPSRAARPASMTCRFTTTLPGTRFTWSTGRPDAHAFRSCDISVREAEFARVLGGLVSFASASSLRAPASISAWETPAACSSCSRASQSCGILFSMSPTPGSQRRQVGSRRSEHRPARLERASPHHDEIEVSLLTCALPSTFLMIFALRR